MHQLYNKRLGKCKGEGEGEGRKHDEEKKKRRKETEQEKRGEAGAGSVCKETCKLSGPRAEMSLWASVGVSAF